MDDPAEVRDVRTFAGLRVWVTYETAFGKQVFQATVFHLWLRIDHGDVHSDAANLPEVPCV